MDSKAIIGISVLLNFVAFGKVAQLYIWPRLQAIPREDGLNALEIDWHGMSLHLGSPYSATLAPRAVEKKEKSVVAEGVTEPGPGVGPLLPGQVDGDAERGRDVFVA